MLKRDEVHALTSCFNTARDDEPMFILLGRDPAAPAAIHAWCHMRLALGKNKFVDPQVQEALAFAESMHRYRNGYARDARDAKNPPLAHLSPDACSAEVEKLAKETGKRLTWQKPGAPGPGVDVKVNLDVARAKTELAGLGVVITDLERRIAKLTDRAASTERPQDVVIKQGMPVADLERELRRLREMSPREVVVESLPASIGKLFEPIGKLFEPPYDYHCRDCGRVTSVAEVTCGDCTPGLLGRLWRAAAAAAEAF